MPLSDAQVRNALPRPKPFKLGDRDGLYLFVQPSGARYWRRNYTFEGRQKTAAIGVYWTQEIARSPEDPVRKKPIMSLTAAREAVAQHRSLIQQGIDPAGQKATEAEKARLAAAAARQARQAARAASVQQRQTDRARRAADRTTFRRVADEWIATCEATWSDKHAGQVRQSLRDHVEPSIGTKPIAELDTGDIDRLLTTMLNDAKIETARRVYQRLSAIWEFAILRRYTDRNPVAPLERHFRARQKQALKLKPRRHFPAVDRRGLPQLLRAMRSYIGEPVTRSAMWLLLLLFVRTGELRHALDTEFDLDGPDPTWVIPPERMKIKLRGEHAAEPHDVPLSRQAIELLRPLVEDAAHRRRAGLPGLLFPKARDPARPISENAVLAALAAIGFKGKQTGHGFRAVASTVLHEAGWLHDAIEAQLAHEKEDETDGAYDRSQHIETRRRMMQAYADMLDAIEQEGAPGSNVVQIRAA